MNELTILASRVPRVDTSPGSVLAAWLRSFPSPNTRDGYQHSLELFARWGGVGSVERAIAGLWALGPGKSKLILLQWRATMIEGGNSPTTVNARLAAVRSCVNFGAEVGAIPWTLPRIRSLLSYPTRDTRGPSMETVRRMLDACDGFRTGPRDRAMILLLLRLRCAEVLSLRVEDVDLGSSTIRARAKGRGRARECLVIPAAIRDALAAWIQVRGYAPGYVFVALDRNGIPRRSRREHPLDRMSVRHILRKLAAAAGASGDVRPHGLRHSGITTVLEQSNGNIVQAQRYARHSTPSMCIRYDDQRRDIGRTAWEAVIAETLNPGGGNGDAE